MIKQDITNTISIRIGIIFNLIYLLVIFSPNLNDKFKFTNVLLY